MITPDTPHAFQAPGEVVATILFEPESAVGRTLLARCAHPGLNLLDADYTASLAAPIASAYFEGADDDELRGLAQRAIAAAAGVSLRPAAVDQRVIRAIAEIRERIDEPILLSALARRAGLSLPSFKSPVTDKPDRGTTNIRHPWFDDWKGYLGVEHRCLVPRTRLRSLPSWTTARAATPGLRWMRPNL